MAAMTTVCLLMAALMPICCRAAYYNSSEAYKECAPADRWLICASAQTSRPTLRMLSRIMPAAYAELSVQLEVYI